MKSIKLKPKLRTNNKYNKGRKTTKMIEKIIEKGLNVFRRSKRNLAKTKKIGGVTKHKKTESAPVSAPESAPVVPPESAPAPVVPPESAPLLESTVKTTKNITRDLSEQVVVDTRKKSTRGLPAVDIYVVTLGTGSVVSNDFGSRNKNLTDDYINTFVKNKIGSKGNGYYQVLLPTPPQSHTILVEVTDVGVNIVDWGGKKNRYRGRKNNKNKKDKKIWSIYTRFIQSLENKFITVTYKPVDEELDKLGDARCKLYRGNGGCSEYLDHWIQKYIGQGKYFPNLVDGV